tara:strand:+ start:357 stop:551 length:195 start_codon:yes stop_codon:yes gene_type:complete
MKYEIKIKDEIGMINTEALHGKANANELSAIKNCIKLKIIEQKPNIPNISKNLKLFFIKNKEIK